MRDTLGYVQTDATTPNNVGTYCVRQNTKLNVRPVSFKRCATTPNNMQHGVQTDATMFGSCWPRILRLFARSFIETGQTFSYVQTDATTLNNVGSCWPTILHLSARDFSYVDSKTLKPRANGRNFFGQQLPTLLDVTCCVRLHTLLHVAACCWELLHKV